MKRILAMLLAAVLVLSMGVVAFAEGEKVAKIGDTEYETLDAAVTAVDSNDDVIILLKDINTNALWKIENKTFTLDFNGYNYTSTANYGIVISTGANIKFVNSSETKTSEIKLDNAAATEGASATIQVQRSGNLEISDSIKVSTNSANNPAVVVASYDNDEVAKLKINKDVAVNGGKGVFAQGNGTAGSATLDFYGTVENATFGISGNGTNGKSGTVINIYDGAVVKSSSDVAIYHPQDGVLNIYGGEITGVSGIEMKAGTVNVSGGTIKATGTVGNTSNSNGSSTTGYAIALVENAVYAGAASMDVSAGTVEGAVDTVEDGEVEEAKKASGEITGGIFTDAEGAEQYIKPGDFVLASTGNGENDESGILAVGEESVMELSEIAADLGETLYVYQAPADGEIEVAPGTKIVNETGEEIKVNGAPVASGNDTPVEAPDPDAKPEPKPEPKPDPCDHKLDANGKCSKCGVVIITYTDGKPADKVEEANPNTGAESVVGVVAAIAAVALAGAFVSKK